MGRYLRWSKIDDMGRMGEMQRNETIFAGGFLFISFLQATHITIHRLDHDDGHDVLYSTASVYCNITYHTHTDTQGVWCLYASIRVCATRVFNGDLDLADFWIGKKTRTVGRLCYFFTCLEKRYLLFWLGVYRY
jgi:hypothetical protein